MKHQDKFPFTNFSLHFSKTKYLLIKLTAIKLTKKVKAIMIRTIEDTELLNGARFIKGSHYCLK